MDSGVNHLKTYGRWAFAEFTEVYQIEADFKAKIESEFNNMIASVLEAYIHQQAHPAPVVPGLGLNQVLSRSLWCRLRSCFS